jgi:hypothetical protein
MDKKTPDDPANLTVRILEDIRDELRGVRAEHAATNERLDRLEKRQSADAIRLATEIVTVAKGIGEVRDLLRDRKAERATLTDHEKRIRTIERKLA